MSKKLTHEKFLEKLLEKNEHYRNGEFEFIALTSYPYVLVKTKFGICKPRRYDLLKNNLPTIKSAIDKNNYCVERFKYLQKVFYNYNLVEYINEKTLVKIECIKHGIFEQTPDVHKKGHGCPKCAIEKSTLPYIELKKRLDGVKNIDSHFLDENSTFFSYLEFTCKSSHKYKQRISDKLYGNGCPVCANISRAIYFEKDKSSEHVNTIRSHIYLLEIAMPMEKFYKIGVAKNVKRRVSTLKSKLKCKINIFYSEEMSILEAYDLEAFYINEFKKFRYYPKVSFAGMTECFKINIKSHFDNIRNWNEDYKINNDKIMCEEYGIDYEQQFNN